MLKFLKKRAPKPTLSQLDSLYANTIRKCPLQEQISYCQRLADRTRYFISRPCPKTSKEHLHILLEAVKTELQKLGSQQKRIKNG
jgi:hypothetical protein